MRSNWVFAVGPELADATERGDVQHRVPRFELLCGWVGKRQIEPRREEDQLRGGRKTGLAQQDRDPQSKAAACRVAGQDQAGAGFGVEQVVVGGDQEAKGLAVVALGRERVERD